MSMSTRLESIIAASKSSQEGLGDEKTLKIQDSDAQVRLAQTTAELPCPSLIHDRAIIDGSQAANYFSNLGATNSISGEPLHSPDSEQDWESWIGLEDANDLTNAACFAECHPLFDLVPPLGLAQIEAGVPSTLEEDITSHSASSEENVNATSSRILLPGEQSDSCSMSARGKVRPHDLDDQDGEYLGSDPEYEETLVNLFFSWHNTLMYVVDKPIFFRERQQFRLGHHTDLYSPALENAVYTIGAAYTDRLHSEIDGPTDEFFGFRAKALLDIEIDSPTIATAQALLVLSSHEAAHARDSRGWIYSGMAVQILSDLGLHLNLALDFSKFHNTDSSVDEVVSLRRNLFWSANTIDTGRPSLMKRLAHNVPSPVPSANHIWEYYTDEYSTMTFPKDFDFHAAAHVHTYLAKLMTVFAQVSEVLYAQ
ncbi:hypothetical protein AYO22_10461 [Fonsecaea multimorphosa]|nr:hypothetical protein AYO22_10461 [Fonsecaea multimorphosa]